MLVVKVEVWSDGDRTRKREVGQMTIGNIGGDIERGDYAVHATERPSDITDMPNGMYEGFLLKNHKRRQSVWALVGLAAVRAVSHYGMKQVRAELKGEREKMRG
jgi:hypothetical protein